MKSYLCTVADFLFSHNMLLQRESHHSLEFPDMFVLELTNEDPTPCWVMILIMNNGKINPMGWLKYSAVIQHHNPLLCTMSHLAFYLFYH